MAARSADIGVNFVVQLSVRHALSSSSHFIQQLTARRLARVAFFVLALVGAREVVGYGLYVLERPPDAPPPAVAQHLRDELRRSGERTLYTVPVSRHVWWSPKSTPGMLAVTDRRLIFVGLVPSLLPPPPADGEAPATELYGFWLDSLVLRETKSTVSGIQGIALRAPGTRERFTILPHDRGAAELLVTGVQRWQIAQRAATARAIEQQEEAAQLARAPQYHRVKHGDALATLATQYHVSVDSLRRWNHLSSNRIRVGDSILVRPGY
jgi:LysM domain